MNDVTPLELITLGSRTFRRGGLLGDRWLCDEGGRPWTLLHERGQWKAWKGDATSDWHESPEGSYGELLDMMIEDCEDMARELKREMARI